MAESTAVVKTKMKREGLALVEPLSEQVKALAIKTAEDYLEADAVLSRVRQARTKWASKMDPIIKPIRTGLDALYALNREVDGPLEAMEKAVKAEMKDYKLEEARQLRDAEAARERERLARQVEIDKKKAAEEKAKTAPMRERLRMAREQLEDAAAEVDEVEAPAPVKSASSVGRKVKKWRVVDLYAARVDEDNQIPEGIIVVDTAAVNQLFKLNPDTVAAWPVFEVYDDIEIAGKR